MPSSGLVASVSGGPLYVGMALTTAIGFLAPSVVGGLDMTVVTGAVVSVWRPDGSTASWTATIVSATALLLTLRYVLQPGDLSVPGIYRAQIDVAVPGGTIPTISAQFRVLPRGT